MPVRPAARHACASRSPSYRCTSLPALLARPAAASRFIPSTSVSAQPVASCACTPHQPPCRFIPPASAPVRPTDCRARASRRPPHRCISPPPSRFIPQQSRPPYPVPQQRIPLPYLFRGKNHRSIFRFTARHAARHCIPPQRTPAPPFALRQESLRPILSNKNAAAKPAPPAAPANASEPCPVPRSRRAAKKRRRVG